MDEPQERRHEPHRPSPRRRRAHHPDRRRRPDHADFGGRAHRTEGLSVAAVAPALRMARIMVDDVCPTIAVSHSPAPPATAVTGDRFPGVRLFAEDRDAKRLTDGAHRAAPLAETLARARSVAPRIGLTRVGFLTGLDRIGAPVAMAVRPNARSAAISLGKGVSPDHALASAYMESIECWHAETIDAPLAVGAAPPGCALDVSRLPPIEGSLWDGTREISWIAGVDMITGAPLWAPYETVHAAYTAPMPQGSG